MEMGSKLKTRLASSITVRDEEISALPLDYGDVALFNPQGGYGSSVLPAVLMLILQQTLVLGIGLSAGTAREANPHRNLIPVADVRYSHPLPIVLGKFMCYLMIYAVMGTWLCAAIPRMFHFPQLATWTSLLALMMPFVIACIFFGMVMSCMVKYRENVMLLVVFISVPLLFMSGVSWPQSNIPGMWQGVSWLFPSTFGARAFVRLNTMGATVADVATELRILWMQAGAYFILAICLYRYQIYRVHRAAHERHLFLQEKYAATKQKLVSKIKGK
jgi:ABC-2 type transport system permease protein